MIIGYPFFSCVRLGPPGCFLRWDRPESARKKQCRRHRAASSIALPVVGRATGEETRKHEEAKEERWAGDREWRKKLGSGSHRGSACAILPTSNPFSPHRGPAACRGRCGDTSINRLLVWFFHLLDGELRI